jgi:lysozyme family protein
VLQRTLNSRFGASLAVDGAIGPKTIAAVNAADPGALFDALNSARAHFLSQVIQNDPSQERFEEGWARRVNDLVTVVNANKWLKATGGGILLALALLFAGYKILR